MWRWRRCSEWDGGGGQREGAENGEEHEGGGRGPEVGGGAPGDGGVSEGVGEPGCMGGGQKMYEGRGVKTGGVV